MPVGSPASLLAEMTVGGPTMVTPLNTLVPGQIEPTNPTPLSGNNDPLPKGANSATFRMCLTHRDTPSSALRLQRAATSFIRDSGGARIPRVAPTPLT